MLYNSNNVEYEKVILYGDFVNSFIDLVLSTYMGDDVTTAIQQLHHFNWCWNKTITNFKNEGINLGKLDNVRIYFLDFMIEFFYNAQDKSPESHAVIKTSALWFQLFDYMGEKTRADIDGFLEVYKLFEKSVRVKT